MVRLRERGHRQQQRQYRPCASGPGELEGRHGRISPGSLLGNYTRCNQLLGDRPAGCRLIFPMLNTQDSAGQHRYAAFISYNHGDRAVAHWLHRALEGYHPPKGVMTEAADTRLRPIFLDRAELPTSSDLAASVREALASSRCLIVVCSPAAAKSRWVNEEIRYFKSLGGADRILALIVGGQTGYSPKANAADCMPPALRYIVSE